MKRPSPRERYLLLAFLILFLAFGAMLLRKYRTPPPAERIAETVREEPRQLREILLYFAAGDGSHLLTEGRQIEDCLETADCLRATVQALLDGPAGEGIAVLPPGATLRGVTEEDGTATVDFSRELVTGHPGGSVPELLTVYALADTLAENFPHIRQVRILVEGEEVETIKGHVDLRAPVQADFSFSRPAAGAYNDDTGSGSNE